MFFKKPFKPKDEQVDVYERIVPIGASHQAVGLRPLDYAIPEEFEAFSLGYTQDVESLITKAKPDMYNKEFCKSIIDAEKYKAMAQLDRQRLSHKRVNHAIAVCQKSAIAQIESEITRYQSLIRELQESLN